MDAPASGARAEGDRAPLLGAASQQYGSAPGEAPPAYKDVPGVPKESGQGYPGNPNFHDN